MQTAVRHQPHSKGLLRVLTVITGLILLVGLRAWAQYAQQARADAIAAMPIGEQLILWDNSHQDEVPCMYVDGGIHSAGNKGDASRPRLSVVQQFPNGQWRVNGATLCYEDGPQILNASLAVQRSVLDTMREYERTRARHSGLSSRLVDHDVYIADHTYLLQDQPAISARLIQESKFRSDATMREVRRNNFMGTAR